MSTWTLKPGPISYLPVYSRCLHPYQSKRVQARGIMENKKNISRQRHICGIQSCSQFPLNLSPDRSRHVFCSENLLYGWQTSSTDKEATAPFEAGGSLYRIVG